jgi:hypothetical protein
MARHIIKRGVASRRHAELAERLAEELASGNSVQPAFIEEEFEATGLRNIHVIWDRWASIPYDERTEVILQAYEKHEGSKNTDSIAVAVGMTGAEAIEAGLIPFVVTERNIDRDFLKYETAKSAEMENTILGTRDLRYPTNEAADQAIKRLQGTLPGSQWQIVQEVNRFQ